MFYKVSSVLSNAYLLLSAPNLGVYFASNKRVCPYCNDLRLLLECQNELKLGFHFIRFLFVYILKFFLWSQGSISLAHSVTVSLLRHNFYLSCLCDSYFMGGRGGQTDLIEGIFLIYGMEGFLLAAAVQSVVYIKLTYSCWFYFLTGSNVEL